MGHLINFKVSFEMILTTTIPLPKGVQEDLANGSLGVDSKGRILFFGSHSIHRIQDDHYLDDIPFPLDLSLGPPLGIALDIEDNIYIPRNNAGTIARVTKDGKNFDIIAGKDKERDFKDGLFEEARFSQPYGILIDKEGKIFVTDSNSVRIMWNGMIHSNSCPSLPLNDPRDMAVDSKGNIFISDNGNNCIRKMDREGNISIFAGSFHEMGYQDGYPAKFYYPNGIAIDSEDNVYVSDLGNHCIRKITKDGITSTFVGEAGNSGKLDGDKPLLTYPFGMVMTQDEIIYVRDESGIRKIQNITKWNKEKHSLFPLSIRKRIKAAVILKLRNPNFRKLPMDVIFIICFYIAKRN